MTSSVLARLLSVSLFLLVSLTGIPAGTAQEGTGSIAGSLFDENGAFITGINTPVYMTNTDSGAVYSSPVTAEGQYAISALPAGTYNLRFPGFGAMYQAFLQEGVEITAGESLAFDLNITWGINLGTIGDDPGMLANDMMAKAGELSGPAPRMPDGKPDFTGMWVNIRDRGERVSIPHQPWAEEMNEELRAMNIQNPGAYCMPQSAVMTTISFPYKFIQHEDVIVQLAEFVTPGFRQIFLDGRDLPAIWNPSYYGHSVGRWEGDTLVVTTRGFNEVTPGFGIHTDQLLVKERYTRPEYGRLLIEITAEDPGAYTAAYTRTFEAGLVPTEEILEFVCAEGNDTSRFEYPEWRGRP